MKVLVLGDIVGDAGCDYVCGKLPELKKQYEADIVIANGENASEGNGILPRTYNQLRNSGVDVVTLGNHGLRRKEIYECLEEKNGLIRPYNYHNDAPGTGVFLYDDVKFKLCVINLQGSVYMQTYKNPFDAIDEALKDIDCKNIIVDFHAEATSEKVSMGYYLDGRVSAIFGTHTHIPTADARILKNGTGYITDVGMCGGLNSVLGVKAEDAVYRARTDLPVRFYNDKEDIKISALFLDIDNSTGRCTGIKQLAFI